MSIGRSVQQDHNPRADITRAKMPKSTPNITSQAKQVRHPSPMASVSISIPETRHTAQVSVQRIMPIIAKIKKRPYMVLSVDEM